MKRIILLVWLALGLLPSLSLSHPGRTDANGGHYNRKTGEYHYHNGGRASTHKTAYLDSKQAPQSQTVYITRTGHKYHRDGCGYLKSRIPVPLKEAKKVYSPCKVCNPPI